MQSLRLIKKNNENRCYDFSKFESILVTDSNGNNQSFIKISINPQIIHYDTF
jgi:hypothetical protein